MSLYGYFTDTDLSSWGSLLFAGLIGIIIALVVNFFLQSPMFEWWISVIGVIIFVGLTAYDTQKIKAMGEAMAGDDAQSLSRVAIVGALALYLDFINLFVMMLEFFGNELTALVRLESLKKLKGEIYINIKPEYVKLREIKPF